MSSRICGALLILLFFASVPPGEAAPGSRPAPSAASPQQAKDNANDLDAFMARVLARRDENWKRLHDYILSETETFELLQSGGRRTDGMRREFMWYVRDGYLVRSPVRFDGVVIAEPDRRKYEQKWLADEKAREIKRTRQAEKGAGKEAQATAAGGASGQASNDDLVPGSLDRRFEPRFVSEAYFLQFKFEPGNYYLVGHERLDDRDVLRIEYYPTHLFDERGKERPDSDHPRRKESDVDRRVEQGLNKVALITLWVDPSELQIVRYTFDNVDFGFLPGRWLVRVDHARASMTMGRVLDGVWLPRQIAVNAGVTLASGTYQFVYGREFYDYKKAETSARIREQGGGARK